MSLLRRAGLSRARRRGRGSEGRAPAEPDGLLAGQVAQRQHGGGGAGAPPRVDGGDVGGQRVAPALRGTHQSRGLGLRATRRRDCAVILRAGRRVGAFAAAATVPLSCSPTHAQTQASKHSCASRHRRTAAAARRHFCRAAVTRTAVQALCKRAAQAHRWPFPHLCRVGDDAHGERVCRVAARQLAAPQARRHLVQGLLAQQRRQVLASRLVTHALRATTCVAGRVGLVHLVGHLGGARAQPPGVCVCVGGWVGGGQGRQCMQQRCCCCVVRVTQQ